MKASDFYTRDLANKPVRIPLLDHRGKPTAEWLEVVGSDSDALHEWNLAFRERSAAIEACATEREKEKLRRRYVLEEVAACAAGWSLEDVFSREAVTTLLGKSDANLVAAHKAIYNDALFFGEPPTDSSDSQNTNSDSPGGQAPATPSAST